MPSTDPQSAAYALILITALVGVLGLLIVILLLAAWRRHDHRMRRLEHRHAKPPAAVDPWREAAQRVEPDDQP